jgi:hypothetical protein
MNDQMDSRLFVEKDSHEVIVIKATWTIEGDEESVDCVLYPVMNLAEGIYEVFSFTTDENFAFWFQVTDLTADPDFGYSKVQRAIQAVKKVLPFAEVEAFYSVQKKFEYTTISVSGRRAERMLKR